MATTAHVYTKFERSALTKKVDVLNDTLKVMLLSSYTVGTTQDTAQFVSDVLAVGTELSATGYTAGGVTITGVTLTDSGHIDTTDCADPNWNPLSGSFQWAVFYDSTPGTNATNPVICFWDLGAPVSPGGQSFTLNISASGLITATGS